MKLITNNPYRVTGILANASARELQKQKAKINAFAKVGKPLQSDLDFSILGDIERNEELINNAFSTIEQNNNKVNHSLFWFLNVTPFDETALNHLKNSNYEKALEIWEKISNRGEVNSKSYSALNNLSTLKFLVSSYNGSDFNSLNKSGIAAKLNLINSESMSDFVQSVADETGKKTLNC